MNIHKFKETHYAHPVPRMLFVLTVLSVFTSWASAVVIDNGQPGTTLSGNWQVSGGVDPYGTDSLWARDGATYTWTADALTAGTYEVFMWWTEFSSRSSAAPVQIVHAGGTTDLTVNQQVNGGQWNSLGTFDFDGSGSVTLTAPGSYPTSYSADAVNFVLTGGSTDETIIDNRDPETDIVGTWPVSGGADPYGADSVYNRISGNSFSWLFTPTSDGFYEVSLWWTEFTSRSSAAPVTIEHADGTASLTVDQLTNGGQWNVLGEYRYEAGTEYRVTISTLSDNSSISADAARFVQVSDPAVVANFQAGVVSGDAPLNVSFTDLSTGTGTLTAWAWDFDNNGTVDSTDQNPSYTYATPGLYTVSLQVTATGPDGTDTATRFDYIEVLDPSAPDEIIIDNLEPETDVVGTWPVSGGADPYGADSVYSRTSGNSFSWLFTPPTSGYYEVSMWWTEFSSRSAAAPVTITHADGSSSLTVNQQINGGQWNVLGEYLYQAGTEYRVTISTLTDNSSISADAVRFVNIPAPAVSANFEANIVNGNVPLEVTFTDTSIGDGTPTAWAWDFNNDGVVDSTAQNPTHTYTAAGTYTVSLQVTVTSPNGSDTETKAGYIVVADPSAPEEIIVDDGDPGTSATGTWAPSGGLDPWDGDSLWARNTGTYTWEYTPTIGGVYEISLWWTEFSSRGSAVPVAIEHQLGTTNLTVNQQINGGRWNVLGQYALAPGETYEVRVSVPGGTPTASADAIRVLRVPVDNVPPVANILNAQPNPVLLNQSITFTGEGMDVDGTIDSYSWTSDIDGPLSSSDSFSTSSLSGGVHTISFTVTDDDGTPSVPTTAQVIVLDAADVEHVYVGFGYGSERPNYQWEEMLNDIGAVEINGLWIYTNPAQDKSYVIHSVSSQEELYAAMKEQDSHILLYGHSNYGLGPIFPTSQEQGNQVIEELYYVDDDRIFNYSTDTVAVGISGMINSQAYPNWYPIYKDGTSAVAPYNFGDPRGNPPHNYYLTYRVPGDSTYYRIDSPREAPLQRFPDSGRSAWYSSTGAEPNPSITSHRQYFITKTSSWEPPFTQTPGWTSSAMVAGYYGSNYLWTDAGNGSVQGTWEFDVPSTGQYTILARWPASSGRTTSAPYTVTHEGGSTTVNVNQQTNGGVWNALGTFTFEASRDWYESRYDVPSLISLNTENIAGNSSKKAAFEASLSGNAYLSQLFEAAQTNVRLEWDIYLDSILNDTTRDRGGMMMVGADTGSGPNEGSGRFVYLAFWSSEGNGGGNGDPDDQLSLIAREPGDSFDDSTEWKEVASGLEYDRWYHVAVVCDAAAGTYDVYLDNVLIANDVSGYDDLSSLTHISFAQWSDGAGGFYVDNVTSDTPGLLVDSDFDDSTSSADLIARDAIRYPVTVSNNTATGNVIADAIMIAGGTNPAPVLQANFYARTRTGSAPLDVTFYDESTGEDEQRTWDFGDGTPTVNTSNSNILHTFANPGTYTVTMTVSSAGSSDTETKVDYITVGSTTQSAEFNGYYREGTAPRGVSFRDRTIGSVQSRLWDFGDGTTSTSTNPSHSYSAPGNYDVSLTVTFSDNSVQTVTKENFVRVVVYEDVIDNVNYPDTHYSYKTILRRGPFEIDPAELKYKRMFYLSCNSGSYYMQTLGRGIVFYSLDDTEVNPGTGFSLYLRAYMQGQSNDQILNALTSKQAAFDYYDFSKRPDQQ